MARWSAIARRIRVPLGFVFAILYLWLAKPTAGSMLIGTTLVIPGLAIRALASGHLQKNEQLATGGPYAYTRNPLYLGGNVFIFLGTSLVLGTLGGIVLTVIHWPLMELMVRREERQLEAAFGDEWRQYKERVRRWI